MTYSDFDDRECTNSEMSVINNEAKELPAVSREESENGFVEEIKKGGSNMTYPDVDKREYTDPGISVTDNRAKETPAVSNEALECVYCRLEKPIIGGSYIMYMTYPYVDKREYTDPGISVTDNRAKETLAVSNEAVECVYYPYTIGWSNMTYLDVDKGNYTDPRLSATTAYTQQCGSNMTYPDVDKREYTDPGISVTDNRAKETPAVSNEALECVYCRLEKPIIDAGLFFILSNEERRERLMHKEAFFQERLMQEEEEQQWQKKEEQQRQKKEDSERRRCFIKALLLALLAYIILFCTNLIKLVLRKHVLLKYSYCKAALLLLWTAGDVEKHPGPPLNDMKTIRELITRLVKEVQGKKVVNWATTPLCWDNNVVEFQDINKMKDSDNEEKYAMFYESVCAYMQTRSQIPHWCVEEMTYVETGNAPELHKCQSARKVRELLEQHKSSDRDDILRKAGYPRQSGSVPTQAVATTSSGSVPTQAVATTSGHQQNLQRCPLNVPGFKPISVITHPDEARAIAKGCIALSKNAGKYQPGNRQTLLKKRPATTTSTQPATKQPRNSAAHASPGSANLAIVLANPAPAVISNAHATSTIARPTTSAVATSSNTGSSISACCTSGASTTIFTASPPSTAQHGQHLNHSLQIANGFTSRTQHTTTKNGHQPNHGGQPSTGTSTGKLSTTGKKGQQPNHGGQPSNGTSTGTQPIAAKIGTQQNPGGQPSNLISLPSDDLADLGFPSNADFNQFISIILKDDQEK